MSTQAISPPAAGGPAAAEFPAPDLRSLTDTELLQRIEELERAKSAAAASQVELAAELAVRRHLASSATEASVGAEVGFARHEGPGGGRRFVAFAETLLHDMPRLHEALARGDLSEERARIIVRETAHLSPAGRRGVDDRLDPRLASLGDRGLRAMVQRLATRVDPTSAEARAGRAREQRHATVRTLGDGTGRLSLTMLAEQVPAVRQALDEAAASARSAGDPRPAGQVRSDHVVAALTGQQPGTPAPVTVDVVVSAEALLGGDDEPAQLPGLGVLPAALVRNLVLRASDAGLAQLRRLYSTPGADELVALESGRRLFPAALADLIRLRDGDLCRSPWCNARIRHLDHIEPASRGGPTSADNGQGLCEACNYLKESPGWVSWVDESQGRHEVFTLTPAADLQRSLPPPLPVTGALRPASIVLDCYFPDAA